MNAKISLFVIYDEAIIYLLLHNFHDFTLTKRILGSERKRLSRLRLLVNIKSNDITDMLR